MKNDAPVKSDRREFLMKTLSSCAFCCFAAPSLFSADKNLHSIAQDQQHKFQSDSGMTIQQVYDFTFKSHLIPYMKKLMKQIGKEKLLNMLKKSAEMLFEIDKDADINYNERTLTAYSTGAKSTLEEEWWRKVLTYEILTDNENVFEIKITECLWEKTFREAEALEIGDAVICYEDYSMARQFNPKLKLTREKTLMKGKDCCHFIYTMEA